MPLLLNAFSLNMLGAFPADVRIVEVSLAQAQALAPTLTSAVGHTDTAAIYSDLLGMPVPARRETVSLAPGDVALVGQYRGPRLAEGTTCLPPGASIQWLRITVR